MQGHMAKPYLLLPPSLCSVCRRIVLPPPLQHLLAVTLRSTWNTAAHELWQISTPGGVKSVNVDLVRLVKQAKDMQCV